MSDLLCMGLTEIRVRNKYGGSLDFSNIELLQYPLGGVVEVNGVHNALVLARDLPESAAEGVTGGVCGG